MEDRDWLILTLLYENGNITKTAQDLYISQPALTSRIKQIENEFQVKLLIRGSKGVTFTPQGEYLVTYAKEMLLKLREAKENILNLNNTVKGTLRIGTSRFLAEHKLPRMLNSFKEKQTDVDFKIMSSFASNIINLVSNHDVHVGFHRGDDHWLGCEHILYREKLYIFSKNKININDLPNIPRIVHKQESANRGCIHQWWTEKYGQPPLIAAEVDHVNACKEMVIHGLGYALLPSSFLSDADHLHKYDITLNNGQPLLRIARMIYLEESLELNVVRAFVNFVKSLKFRDKLA